MRDYNFYKLELQWPLIGTMRPELRLLNLHFFNICRHHPTLKFKPHATDDERYVSGIDGVPLSATFSSLAQLVTPTEEAQFLTLLAIDAEERDLLNLILDIADKEILVEAPAHLIYDALGP